MRRRAALGDIPGFVSLREKLTTPEAIALHEQTLVVLQAVVTLGLVGPELFGERLTVHVSFGSPYTSSLMTSRVSLGMDADRGARSGAARAAG